MDINLRQAKPTDMCRLVALLNLCYRGDPTGKLVGWTDERELVGGIRTTPDELTHVMADPYQHLFVYPEMISGEESGELLGSILVGFKHSDGRKSQNTATIGTFCVHPSLQGRGVGSTILYAAETFAVKHLSEAKDALSGGCSIKMYVLSQRTELLAFYKRRGYMPTGKTMPFPVDGNHGKPKCEDLVLLELVKAV